MEEGSRVEGDDDMGDENSRRQMELDDSEEGEEETKCKAAIEVEKRVYKGSFQVNIYARRSGELSPSNRA